MHAGLHQLFDIVKVDADHIGGEFADPMFQEDTIQPFGALKPGGLDFDERVFFAEGLGVLLNGFDALIGIHY